MIIEVVGNKGVVGGATYKWMKEMTHAQVEGWDAGESPPVKNKPSVSFICVPESNVEKVCKIVAEYAALIVIRSTVPPGTCAKLQDKLRVHICHNPEFLRESSAIQDTFTPNHILLGVCCRKHEEWLKQIYQPACVPIMVTDPTSSELTKIITNDYLACLISFWNEVESITRAAGISGHRIGALASLDPRITEYGAKWHHKYGGKCLPKEINQTIKYAEENQISIPLIRAIKEVNDGVQD